MTLPLRVLVDATAIPHDLGGVGRYLQELIPALASDPDLNLFVVAQERDAPWIAERAPRAAVHAIPPRFSRRLPRLIWEQFGLGRHARRVGAELIHSPHYTMPMWTKLPVVVTVHDATFFSSPEVHTTVKRRFFRWWTRYSVTHAQMIVTPSIATREQIEKYTDLQPATAVVAYHGVNSTFFRVPSPADVAAARERLGLPGTGWITFLGTIEPRKNVPGLITAYAALASIRPVPPLVIAGANGWDRETRAEIDRLGPSVEIRMLGYVEAELLPGLLGGSRIFVYPSLGEGFGLPVLEAMACGAPTLTTRLLAIPEVGGDAVAYTEPGAPEIATAMGKLLDDDSLRQRLAAAGPQRARKFTWVKSAAEHADAYRRAVSS